MKIRIDRRRGLAAAAWLLVVFFLIFVILIGTVFFTVVKTIKKIIPPPPPDDDGYVHMPAIGDKYQGGTVTAYVPPPHLSAAEIQDAAPPGFTVHRVFIFAADAPYPNLASWTNCIWQGDLADVDTVIGTNGLPMESWPAGQMPSQRFYNIVASNSFAQ